MTERRMAKRTDHQNHQVLEQYTSYHSKMDPSNTVFAFDESSLEGLVKLAMKN
jgi:hypothetical protein